MFAINPIKHWTNEDTCYEVCSFIIAQNAFIDAHHTNITNVTLEPKTLDNFHWTNLLKCFCSSVCWLCSVYTLNARWSNFTGLIVYHRDQVIDIENQN